MPRLKQLFSSLRFKLPFGAVIFLLICFAIYYFAIIVRQEASVDDRAFRTLAATGTQIKDAVGTYSIVFAGATRQKRQQQGDSPNETDRPSHLFDFLATQAPKLEDVQQCTPAADAKNPKTGLAASDAEVTAAISFQPGGYSLQLASGGTCAYVTFENLVVPLIAQTPSLIFDDIVVADDYGRVLYQTERSGVVADSLFSLDLPPGTSDATDSSGKREKSSRNESISANKITTGHSAAPSLSGPEATSFLAATGASRLFRMTLAGADYRLYAVPVRLPVPKLMTAETTTGARLVLVGLMTQDHFATHARAVSITVLAATTMAIVLVMVSAWPILKFSTMRRSEEITRRAGLYYALSCTFSIIVAMLLVIHLPYGFADPKTNNNMEDLAAAIDANVGEELAQASLVMDAVSAMPKIRHAKVINHKAQPCGRPPDGKAPEPETDLLSRVGMEVSQYPYFRRLFIYDSQGYEQVRWTVYGKAPPPLRVCDRPYFLASQRNDLWYLKNAGLTGPRFRVDPIYSESTGEYLAAVARPYQIQAAGKPPDEGVMMMITPMLSLMDPVLPPDYGFAVIDPMGKVLFHSDPTKNGRENFFDELADSEELRAAVLARRPNWLRESYLGDNYGLFVTPFTTIRECPWSLLVFSNRNVLGDKELERTLLLGLLCVMYFVLLIGISLISRRLLASNRIAWPTESTRGIYLHLFIVLLFALVLSYAFIFQASPKELLCFAVVIPVSAVGFSILKLQHRESPIIWTAVGVGGLAFLRTLIEVQETGNWWKTPYLTLTLICMAYLSLGDRNLTNILNPRRKPSLATAYSLACLALLVLSVGIPCVAFFKLSYDYDENLTVRRQQLLTMSALNTREQRVIGEYLNVNMSGSNVPFSRDIGKWLFLRRRLQEQKLDVYDNAFRDQTSGQVIEGENGGRWPERWVSLNAELRIRRSQFLTSLVAENSEEGGEWVWDQIGVDRIRMSPKQQSPEITKASGSPESLALYKLALHDPMFLSQSLVSNIDTLRPWDFLSQVWLTLLGLLVAIFFSVRSTVTKMFLLKSQVLDEWQALTIAEAIAGTINCILISQPRSGKTESLMGEKNIAIIDVAVALSTSVPLPTATVVALDHFECGLAQGTQRQSLLELLGALLKANKKVLIVTTVDPRFWFADEPGAFAQASGNNPAGAGLTESDTKEWTRILAGFVVACLKGGSVREPKDYYYHLLWSSCTWSEKIALHSLAKGGWANHKILAALQHLENRHLIYRNPAPQLTDKSFGEFIAGDQTEAERKSWRLHDTTGTWEGLRTTLIVLVLGGLAALIFFSHSDMLGILTGVAGALAAAAKIVSDLRGPSKDGGKNGTKA